MESVANRGRLCSIRRFFGFLITGKKKNFKFGFVELFEGIKMPLTVNSPTACGRSPLGEGALGRG